ncbi:PREDICTED: pentatricopeptide repeat-containing protein At2g02750 [Tarenaya hassleriana]|uniref:pentatricopeptide repeat-containing protein At2g02750 n=1 Tax=Tarenaya hassleriana TaxID=28532 RepID=UPI00053C9DAD|nr:PREDICTED: pentatricopeptide repeat-containing protein At2g02750 [Tarenaya hassleriana]
MRHRIQNLVTGGFYQEAVLCTRHYASACSPNKFTFPPLLKACAKLGDVVNGRVLHAQIVKTGFFVDVFTATALMSMYMKVEHPFDARKVLDEMPDRNAASSNAAISGFLQNGFRREAFSMFREVRLSGFGTNSVTVASVLGGCEDVEGSMQMHCLAIKLGVEMDVYVGTSLVSMYSRCSEWILAAKMFESVPNKSVVTYNAFLSGLLENGLLHLVLDAFNLMKRFSSEKPNAITLINVISACASLLHSEFGRQIHGIVMKTEFQFDAMVGTCLVDMYSKCHCWKSAYKVFDELQCSRNLITWNSIISGMMMNGKYERAVELFEQLESEGLEADSSTWNSLISGFSQSGKGVEAFECFKRMLSVVTVPSLKCLTSLLPACSDLLALKNGKEIHGHVIKAASERDIFVATSLIDMYMKCGFFSWARRIFNQFIPKPKDPVFWNVMISGYGKNGEYESAIEIFDQLQDEKVEPSSATFTGVLSACSHCGKVEKGFHLFRLMHDVYGLKPSTEHIGCMVDLLGRYGRLKEAKELIDEISEPSPSAYSSLLGACMQYLDPKLGEEMATKLSELEPENPAPFVILSSIYAALGRWKDVETTRQLIDDKRLVKHPGHSLAGLT